MFDFRTVDTIQKQKIELQKASRDGSLSAIDSIISGFQKADSNVSFSKNDVIAYLLEQRAYYL